MQYFPKRFKTIFEIVRQNYIYEAHKQKLREAYLFKHWGLIEILELISQLLIFSV